jgi:hypothetical protein
MSQSKEVGSISAKLIAVLLVIAVVFGVAWFIKGQAEEIGALKLTVGAQKQTLDKFEKEAKLDKDSNAVTDHILGEAVQERQDIYNGSAVTADKTAARDTAIRQKYGTLIADAKARNPVPTPPKTPEPDEIEQLIHQQEQEISANRLDGVWEDYCRDPDATGCPVPTAT